MIDAHLERAIFEACPHIRKGCPLAFLGCCEAVNNWIRDHKAGADHNYLQIPQGGNHERKRR